MILNNILCCIYEPALWYGLIGAVVGSIVSFILMLCDECRKYKHRINLSLSDIRLLTKQSITYLQKCMEKMDEYAEKINREPYVPQQLQEGVLEPFKRIQRLNTTIVFEVFKYKKKENNYRQFFQDVDQIYALLNGLYMDYHEHNKSIVLFCNEFQQLVADCIYLCQQQDNDSKFKPIIEAYETKTANSSVDISIQYKTLIEPLMPILTPEDMSLYAKLDRARYLYQTIEVHQKNLLIMLFKLKQHYVQSFAILKG